jgi:hypothetical protein
MPTAEDFDRALTAARSNYRDALAAHSEAAANIKSLGPEHPDTGQALRIANHGLEAARRAYTEALSAYTLIRTA